MICAGCGARFDGDECGLCGRARADLSAYEDVVAWFETIKKWDPNVVLDEVGPSVEAAAWLLRQIVDARSALAMAESELSRFLADLIPWNQPHEIDGVGALTIRSGSTRKEWDHTELRRDVTVALADRLALSVADVERVLAAFFEIATPSWKVGRLGVDGGLRGLGLDPDEYSSKRPGPPRAVLE